MSLHDGGSGRVQKGLFFGRDLTLPCTSPGGGLIPLVLCTRLLWSTSFLVQRLCVCVCVFGEVLHKGRLGTTGAQCHVLFSWGRGVHRRPACRLQGRSFVHIAAPFALQCPLLPRGRGRRAPRAWAAAKGNLNIALRGGGGGGAWTPAEGGGGVGEMGFRVGPFVLCKNGCWRQRHRNTKFGPKKFFPPIIPPPPPPPHLSSQNDQRDVGITVTPYVTVTIDFGLPPPPPPARQVGRPRPEPPLPSRWPRREGGGLGKWASVSHPPPPPAEQFSSRPLTRSARVGLRVSPGCDAVNASPECRAMKPRNVVLIALVGVLSFLGLTQSPSLANSLGPALRPVTGHDSVPPPPRAPKRPRAGVPPSPAPGTATDPAVRIAELEHALEAAVRERDQLRRIVEHAAASPPPNREPVAPPGAPQVLWPSHSAEPAGPPPTDPQPPVPPSVRVDARAPALVAAPGIATEAPEEGQLQPTIQSRLDRRVPFIWRESRAPRFPADNETHWYMTSDMSPAPEDVVVYHWVTTTDVQYHFTFALDRQALRRALAPLMRRSAQRLVIVTFANLKCARWCRRGKFGRSGFQLRGGGGGR